MFPDRITITRSLRAKTSGSSELINSTAVPRVAISVMILEISALAATSTPLVGSSKIKSLGLSDNQRPRTTFC